MMETQRKDGWIFDFGMHKGLDTEFYLKKGFSVVAIEANPLLAQEASRRLDEYKKSGRLIIKNVGIGPKTGHFPFYVNLENDERSSFDKNLGTRENTKYKVIDIECITADQIFEEFGIPYYAKIDIEGYDLFVLDSIEKL